MGPEVALASSLIGGATATAGASTGMMALSMGMTLGQTFMGYQQQKAAGEAARIDSEIRASEIRLQQKAESAQNAEDQAELQRRARRKIAMQQASFAGAGVDLGSGTARVINKETESEFQRAMDSANLKSGLAIKSLNRQALSVLRAGSNKRSAFNSSATTSLISGLTTVAGQYNDYKSVQQEKSGLNIDWND